MSRIPLTLITGYLGAGKTTLLNALLRDSSAGRIAVVVNEFGDVGLDHDLIVETTEETVLLSSGCMCCTVRGDLVQALEGLFEKRSVGKLDFDRIVIETTGLADPAPILHTLIVTPGLSTALRMDGVVTVCDAVNGPATLDAGFESVQRVAMADVLVLSKTDLVTPSKAERFRARLAALAPGARIVTATRGAVPLNELFGHGAPDMNGALPEAEAWVNAPAYALSSLPLSRPAKPLAPLATGPTHGLFGLAPAPGSSLMAAIAPHLLGLDGFRRSNPSDHAGHLDGNPDRRPRPRHPAPEGGDLGRQLRHPIRDPRRATHHRPTRAPYPLDRRRPQKPRRHHRPRPAA